MFKKKWGASLTSLFSHSSFTYPLHTPRSNTASMSSWRGKKPDTFRQGPDFQAQVNHLVIKTGKAGLKTESPIDPLTTGVCSRFEGRSSYVFFLVHLTASSKLDKNLLKTAVIFLKILGSAGKQLRIAGRQALNRLDYRKDYLFVRSGRKCSAVQNLHKSQTNSHLPGPGAQKPLHTRLSMPGKINKLLNWVLWGRTQCIL